MTTFLASTNEITPAWLESVLGMRVLDVSMRENAAFNSAVAHLELTYSSNTDLPHNILVKLNREHEGQNEVQFYRLIKSMELPMIPRRAAMDYDSQTGLSYLLLEDLSKSHIAPVTREQLIELDSAPSVEYLESMVDALAHFHAAFWEHPSFGSIPDTTEMRWWYKDAESHARHVERRRGEWTKFVELFGHDVPAKWIMLGESALEALPKLFETRIRPRLRQMRGLTMSQGDCYLSQFLVPRVGSGDAYLIDFQDACVNFPTYDLVYMFATFWTREQRGRYEENLLRRYLNGLQSRGVNYEWEDLCDDYRLCLSYMLFDAVWNATSGSSRAYWQPKLGCLVAAYQDWGCA